VCGTETRVCHEQRLCNGREAACPDVDRISPEGSTCSDANGCTVEDTCQQGRCVPGPAVCQAAAAVRGNGKAGVRIKVVCETDVRSECDVSLLANSESPTAMLLAKDAQLGEEKAVTKRARGGGPLPFRIKLVLRPNARGRALLKEGDVNGRVVLTIRRNGSELQPPVSLVHLLRVLRRP